MVAGICSRTDIQTDGRTDWPRQADHYVGERQYQKVKTTLCCLFLRIRKFTICIFRIYEMFEGGKIYYTSKVRLNNVIYLTRRQYITNQPSQISRLCCFLYLWCFSIASVKPLNIVISVILYIHIFISDMIWAMPWSNLKLCVNV